MLMHSLLLIDVTRDTSQASMAPCVEPASQPAPVPDFQGWAVHMSQYVSSPDPRTSLHAPTHPNSAVCSALRSAKAAASAPGSSSKSPPHAMTSSTAWASSAAAAVAHGTCLFVSKSKKIRGR